MQHISGNKHTAADGLSWRPMMEDETEDKKNINDFIDSQLNAVWVSVSEIDNKNDILESEYFTQHQQIAHYLIIL